MLDAAHSNQFGRDAKSARSLKVVLYEELQRTNSQEKKLTAPPFSREASLRSLTQLISTLENRAKESSESSRTPSGPQHDSAGSCVA